MKYLLPIYDDEKTFAKMTQADLGRMYAEVRTSSRRKSEASGNHVGELAITTCDQRHQRARILRWEADADETVHSRKPPA